MIKKKLLVIDDDEGFLQIMQDFFKPKGYDVKGSSNFDDAMRIFRRDRPKVVLLDFNMPLVSGEKVLPILQSIEPAVRVIVITGYLQEEVEEKFKGLGYFAFFKKGDLSLEDVKDKVEEALSY